MRILVVGDCHGDIPDIDDEVEDSDIILAVGDICGDSREMREAMFEAIDTGKRWFDILGRENTREKVEKSLEEGREVLEYLNSFGKPVFLVPGNWDWNGNEEGWGFLSENRFQQLVDEFQNIHNIEGECMETSGHCFIGYGPAPAPEVPQYEEDMPEDEEEMMEIKRSSREEKQRISRLFENSNKPVIFLSHNVPNNTSLDLIEDHDSPAEGRHYGSLVVKEIIEEFHPVVSAAGHMHEGYGHEKIVDTVSINAGLESCVVLDLGNGKVEDLDFRPSLDDYGN